MGRSLLEGHLGRCFLLTQQDPSQGFGFGSRQNVGILGCRGGISAEPCGHCLAAPNSFFGSWWLPLVSIRAGIA